ncbi:TetR/AcrR family transcriptional regulator [uncultured Cellulomonas sp.]|uniref:TetR/AcrR family transcriptional regulator n=1 Tax=uncultured Cellulomonas sp. TaxID=189682 RepID=UPI002615D3DA|nr:TetR/AcrR family transcriptional regulator [uncultured Cellulomonas sp.]
MVATGEATDDGSARPLRADAERNRRHILDVAAEVFAERGLAATLNDVAHRAGIGVGTVYRRFPDKDALVEALWERKFVVLLEVAEHAAASPTGADAVRSFVCAAAEARARDRGLVEVLARAPSDRTARQRARLHAMVDEMVVRAQREGAIRPDVVAADVPLLVVMVAAVADCARDVAPDLWRRYTELLLDGLRPGPGTTELSGPPLEPGELGSVLQRRPA